MKTTSSIYITLINQFAIQEGWNLVEEDGIFIQALPGSNFKESAEAIEHVVDSAIENPKGFHADALVLMQVECRPSLFFVKKVVGLDKWIKLYAAVMAVPEFA
jgi:hypothetical protein